LFVGGGGPQQQIPKGVEGEDDEQVRFERRREKERKRDVSGKRKNMKDKDWILKKKEVSRMEIDYTYFLIDIISCIANEEKRGYREIQNLLAASASQSFSGISRSVSRTPDLRERIPFKYLLLLMSVSLRIARGGS
jgi:hypothetical protein